jgi:2-hydroxychromene-2-carboxylate isomerase
MPHIDYYFSTISPYAYLAGDRLETIAARHGATIAYKPVDVLGLFARTGGTAPPDRHPSRMDYRAQDLVRHAKVAGLPFNLKPAHWPTNAAPPAYAIIAAQKAGGDTGALVRALMRACWVGDQDIAEDAVIRACLEETGFDPGLADSGLLVGAETYARNLEEAIEAGAFGSPFYIMDDGARFFGQDRLDHLDLHLAGEL